MPDKNAIGMSELIPANIRTIHNQWLEFYDCIFHSLKSLLNSNGMFCKADLGLETSTKTICPIAQNLNFKKLWKKSQKMCLLAWPLWNEWSPNLFSTEFPSDDNDISI